MGWITGSAQAGDVLLIFSAPGIPRPDFEFAQITLPARLRGVPTITIMAKGYPEEAPPWLAVTLECDDDSSHRLPLVPGDPGTLNRMLEFERWYPSRAASGRTLRIGDDIADELHPLGFRLLVASGPNHGDLSSVFTPPFVAVLWGDADDQPRLWENIGPHLGLLNKKAWRCATAITACLWRRTQRRLVALEPT